jgi:hypothetical protein
MAGSTMVTEVAVKTEEMDAEFTLKYYVDEWGQDLTVYGLRIEKYVGNRLLETESTPALYEQREQAEALAARFARGTVTPMTLLLLADEFAYPA